MQTAEHQVELAGLTVDTRHYIGGQRFASESTFESISPIDGTVLAHVARGGAGEADAAVRAARSAFPGWRDLGPEGRANATVVVATSDEPAMMRLRAAWTATRIAEWHAAQGRDVLLMMDSLTRVAMAQREVGLAAGEPPTTRGYPPSVFGLLPALLERAGPHAHGTITGLYTVLVEGDDLEEPITDHARSILDGHSVLSRRIAGTGRFPAIDVPASSSRLVSKILPKDRQKAMVHARSLIASLEEARDLLELGAYTPGSNPLVDEALRKRDRLDALLLQPAGEPSTWEDAAAALDLVVQP